MAKRRQTARVRIPSYRYPRNVWRELIHAEVTKCVRSRKIKYNHKDKLELIITLYLDEKPLQFHDVDNRLKDIMDALQGRVGGSKSQHKVPPIIPNDHQIYRVTIEKMLPPKQSHGMGHLIITKYKPMREKIPHRTT